MVVMSDDSEKDIQNVMVNPMRTHAAIAACISQKTQNLLQIST